MSAPPVCHPVYIFERRRDLETATRILAGRLSYNGFGRRRLSHRHRRQMGEIIDGLTRDVRAGLLPDLKVGWPDIRPPLNAANVSNEMEMAWWRARAFVFNLRVAADGEPTFTRAHDTAEVKARLAKLKAKVEP